MRELPILPAFCFVLFGCLLIYAANTAGAAPGQTDGAWRRDVHLCFVRALDDARRSSGDAGVRYGREAGEIFLAEQIVSLLESDPNRPADPRAFCEEKVALFRSTVANAVKQFDARKDGTLAKLGSAPISNSPFLVATYQNLIGKHYRGHSDITDAALNDVTGMSKDARALVVSASQSPDLYRWADDRFHAQTADYPPNELATKTRQVVASQTRFLDLLARLVSLASEFAQAGDVEAALGSIGIASHLVQDLTYHGGMTLTQHAGLSYALKMDPDQPKAPADRVRFEQAVSNTSWLLNIVLRNLRPRERTRLLEWRPDGGFSYERLMRRIYGRDGGSDQQDISTSSLLAYYDLAEEYSSGRRPIRELDEGSCASAPGLACWPIRDVKSTIEARFP